MSEEKIELEGDDERFAENMRVIREGLGWSQGEMARRMQEAGWGGFHQTTVSRIEKGDRPVKIGEALAIAGALGVSLDQLLALSERAQMLARLFAARDETLALAQAKWEADTRVRLSQARLKGVLREAFEDVRDVMTDGQADVITGLLQDPPVLPSDKPPF